MKVAVIGVGSMGQHHARVYSQIDNVELVAISDPNKVILEKISSKLKVKGFTDYKEMLNSIEIDAVSIVVPTSLHKDVSIYCLNKKKHVLLEKPIASNEQESIEIINCAKENNVQLMIGHIERFNPAIISLKEKLHEIGEIYKIDIQRIGPFPSRITDVGVIIDLSVHDLDIINYLTNAKPIRIFAETQKKLHPSQEDSVTALIKYNNNMLASINTNYLSPKKIRQLKIFGEKGMFMVDYLTQELLFHENKGFSKDCWDTVTEGNMTKIYIQKKEPLLSEIEAFLNSINCNTNSPVSGEQGLSALNLANKIIQSSSEEKIILLK